MKSSYPEKPRVAPIVKKADRTILFNIHPIGRYNHNASPRITQYNELDQVTFIHPFKISSKEQNKHVHIINGNNSRRGKPMTICYWNKGSSLLSNKQEDISEIIQKYKPLVLGIGEAQFKSNQDLADVQQPGFTLHLDSCQASLGVSRCAVYTHKR